MNKNKEHRYHELVMHGPCTYSVPAVAVEDMESVLNSFDFCKCTLACVQKAWRFRALENIKDQIVVLTWFFNTEPTLADKTSLSCVWLSSVTYRIRESIH